MKNRMKALTLGLLAGLCLVALPAAAGVRYVSEDTTCAGMASVGANFTMRFYGGSADPKRCIYWIVDSPYKKSQEVTWHGNGKVYSKATASWRSNITGRYDGYLDVWSGKGFTGTYKRSGQTDQSSEIAVTITQRAGIKSFKFQLYEQDWGS